MKVFVQVLAFVVVGNMLSVSASAEPLDFRGDPVEEQISQQDDLVRTAADAGQLTSTDAAGKQDPPLTYTVIAGDTLYAIAIAHDIPLDSLTAWNGITGELIHPGDVLNVSREAPGSATNEARMATLLAQAANRQAASALQQSQTVADAGKAETGQPAAAPSAKTETVPVSGPSGRELTMTATAYTAYCAGCSGTTRTGIDLRANPGLKVIAVDPSVIPLGSRVWVEGYGEAIAGDTGGAIKGQKIDVFIPSRSSAMAWGVKKVRVKVLN